MTRRQMFRIALIVILYQSTGLGPIYVITMFNAILSNYSHVEAINVERTYELVK